NDPQVSMMRNWVAQAPKAHAKPTVEKRPHTHSESAGNPAPHESLAHIFGYLSDLSTDTEDEEDTTESTESFSHHPTAPPLKRRKLDVPYRVERAKKRKRQLDDLAAALRNIEKVILSKKTQFAGGIHGLQAKRAHTVQSHLLLVVRNGRNFTDASQRAAESHGFASGWGGRQLRSWTRAWVNSRELPKSRCGCHTNVYSLLSDPDIAGECRTYLRSNKWAVNPEKLAQFTSGKLIHSAASKYLQHVVEEEMPKGLKKYLELELFPHIHMKVARGVSLSTARRWMRSEGFRYISHKKGLYFDGHNRPDVVEYRQNIFLPFMKACEPRLVQYVVGDVEKELETQPLNYVERRLVLVPHDEMTAQANNDADKTWVCGDEHRLKKKGVGRGIQQSDVICSTVGYLTEASESLEYGKNHMGYWTGEHFVKQLHEKIIPAFEHAHGAGYQALFLIDNSQGHSAYAEDALLVWRMNINPGGKQAHLHNGWYIHDGQTVSQSMVYPNDHPQFPNQPKGIKAVLIERGLYKSGCRGGARNATLMQMLFVATNVKKYLRDNCDYTFDTLKKNMPLALASVSINTI
ncbi:hypothetical protein CY34DRAFT_106542, partial [Suillus luteus UH-Slu-Lm8-n1]